MNFEDEGWVKLYKRKTPRWMSMPWQARALYPLLMKEVDRYGVFDCDGLDVAMAVSLAVLLPDEVVGVGLQGLFDSGAAHIAGGNLVLPNFSKAQAARTSPAERKRRQREGEVAPPSTESLPEATHETSQNKQPCHAESQQVTRGHAVSRIEENRIDQNRRDNTQDAGGVPVADAPRGSKSKATRASRLPADWTPDADLVAWAKGQGFDPHGPLEEFRDHWAGVPGARGTKLDWGATYRNRLRALGNRQSGTFTKAGARATLQPTDHSAPWMKVENLL